MSSAPGSHAYERPSARAESWRAAVYELASYERASASEGERRAAESIAAWLRERGCEAVVEQEQAHGGYWWPLGIANCAALAAAWLGVGTQSPNAAMRWSARRSRFPT
jgi:hypothetical protein